MPATIVDLCNAALIELEMQPIDSIDDEEVQTAIVCRAVFADCVRDVLRAHPWSCAGARVQLPALADAPAFGWLYAYQLPADCLAVRDIGVDLLYEIEGLELLTDADSPIDLRYTRDLTLNRVSGRPIGGGDVLPVDAGCANAIVFRLAARIAKKLTGSSSAAEEMRANYARALAVASSLDAGETPRVAITGSDWLSDDL